MDVKLVAFLQSKLFAECQPETLKYSKHHGGKRAESVGTAQVKSNKNLNNSSFNNARSWHDEAYLYINQAITQVSPDAEQAGH